MKKTITAIIISTVTTIMMATSAMAASPETIVKAQQIVATIITPDMTDIQKVQACNNYLKLTVSYDDTYQFYTADAALLYGVAVCQGYSEAFKLLMDLCAVPCEIVSSEELDHAWNRVYIGGVPYDVDVTWNSIGRTDKFTLLSVDQMANEHYRIAANDFVDFDDEDYGPVSEADLAAAGNKLKSATKIGRVLK